MRGGGGGGGEDEKIPYALAVYSSGDDANIDGNSLGESVSFWNFQPERCSNVEEFDSFVKLLHQELLAQQQLAHANQETTLLTYCDGGSMPLGHFLSGEIRIITQRTAISIPRLLIGSGRRFFTLVTKATSEPMARYLALTRRRLFGSDALFAGLATHFIPASKKNEVEILVARASACPPPHTAKAITSSLSSLVEYAGPSRLKIFQKEIDKIFKDNDLEQILKALEEENTNWSQETLRTLKALPQPELQATLQFLAELSGKESSLELELNLGLLSSFQLSKLTEKSQGELKFKQILTSPPFKLENFEPLPSAKEILLKLEEV